MKISSLQDASTRDIKDGGRAIALALFQGQKGGINEAESIGSTLSDDY